MMKPRHPRIRLLSSSLVALAGAWGLASCNSGVDVPASTRSAALDGTPAIGDFVIYAERSVRLGRHDRVEGGDVGVRSGAPSSFGPQLVVGDHALIDPRQRLVGASVQLGDDARTGEIDTGALTVVDDAHHGTVAAFPAAAMPPLPVALATSAGAPVTVAPHHALDLAPGSYGALLIGEHARVRLAAGTYSFARIVAGEHARIAGSRDGVDVRVAGDVMLGALVDLGPDDERTSATRFSLTVAGGDAQDGTPVVRFGEHDRVRALVAAPNGTLSLAEHVEGRGAFAGFDVVAGEHAALCFDGGFPETAPGGQGLQQLSGYAFVPNDPAVAPVVGPVPLDTPLTLAVALPVSDPDGLRSFVHDVSDPTSPSYRHFLTQDAFYAAYGASPSDYQALTDWATASGFTVRRTFPNRLLIGLSAPASVVENALHTNLILRERSDGSTFVAVDREPSLDLTVPVLELDGLQSSRPVVSADLNGTGAGGTYRAADLRAAYLGTGPVCDFDGSGQVVGLLVTDLPVAADVTAYDARQVPPRDPTKWSVVEFEGGNPAHGQARESTLDVEMVQAMAPGAQVLVFQGDSGITGHLDEAMQAMATSSPPITVGSSSLLFRASGGAQQALDEMAAQGVSFFQGSGDDGDVGDPQNNIDMDQQTLVGGTALSTLPLLAGPTYPPGYYVGEDSWVQDVINGKTFASGGGVMDGDYRGGNLLTCACSSCCGGGMPIPDYQAGIDMTGNGGSTLWRNYPDVALPARDIDAVLDDGITEAAGGTSAASPMWAGFMALVNERAGTTGAGQVGFANPAIYDLGLTRGSADDLYAATFHDVQGGSSNQTSHGGGFTAEPGYDLVTGWGSPTCQLLVQLSSSDPLTQQTTFSQVDLLIATGGDDLRDDSGATADLLLPSGDTITTTLKTESTPAWTNGSIHVFHIQIPSTEVPPLTESDGLVSVTINLVENYLPPETADNWNITDVEARIENPGSDQFCQLDLPGTASLPSGGVGLVRLSETAGSSGAGPSVTFAGGSGCTSTGSAIPASPAQLQLIIGTSDDDARDDSDVTADLFALGDTSPFQHVVLKASGDPAWANDTIQNLKIALVDGAPPIDHVVLTLGEHPSFPEGDDHWHVAGINMLRWDANAPMQCMTELTGHPLADLGGSAPANSITLVPRSGCP